MEGKCKESGGDVLAKKDSDIARRKQAQIGVGVLHMQLPTNIPKYLMSFELFPLLQCLVRHKDGRVMQLHATSKCALDSLHINATLFHLCLLNSEACFIREDENKDQKKEKPDRKHEH